MTGSLLYTKEIVTKVLWMRDKDRIDLYEDGVRLSTFRVVGKNKSFTEDTCRSVYELRYEDIIAYQQEAFGIVFCGKAVVWKKGKEQSVDPECLADIFLKDPQPVMEQLKALTPIQTAKERWESCPENCFGQIVVRSTIPSNFDAMIDGEDAGRSVKHRLVLRAPYGRHFVKAGFTAGVDTGGTASSLEYTAPAWVELSENTPIVYLKAKRRFIAPFSESGMKLVPDKK